jgi:hypothetical protein
MSDCSILPLKAMYDLVMGKRLYEFVKTAGVLGGGSVMLSIICFGITFAEHVRDHSVLASVFGFLTIIFFCFGAFQAWSKERDARLEIERKYFDESPQIGLELLSAKGPTAWRNATTGIDACSFWLLQLGGRTATSIRFDPIRSKGARFTLNFDAVPFLEPSPRRTALTYHVGEVGFPRLSAHDLEKTGDMEGTLLKSFLDDSAPELDKLQYALTARYRDKGGEECTRSFNLVFDRSTYSFQANTD